MVEELEISAIKLAKERAWREMAKQVAHEIKTR
jgi:nitrogen fixation/metabolism regulation signal transduction histidine kinase